MKQYQQKKKEVTDRVAEKFKAGYRPAVTTDEYSSKAVRKYINCNLHHLDLPCDNLGLKRCRGAVPADKLGKLITEHLNDFGVNLRLCSALVTDGASVNKKMGRSIDTIHLLCQSHGINLAVTDNLFIKEKKGVAQDDTDTQIDDTEIEVMYGSEQDTEVDFSAPIELGNVEDDSEIKEKNLPQILPIYRVPIKKLRKVISKINHSTKRKDILEDLLRKNHGKNVVIPLDVKTRLDNIQDLNFSLGIILILDFIPSNLCL